MILKETEAHIVIAGRRGEEARILADKLNLEFSPGRVSWREVDAGNLLSLETAFEGVDLVLIASTTPQYTDLIARAVLKSNCDYMDILVRQDVWTTLLNLKEEIAQSGKVFISGAGFHPGLPAVLIRNAVQYFDKYLIANIYMAMNARFTQPSAAIEIVEEAGQFNVDIMKDGKWKKATLKDFKKFDFGGKFGVRSLFPLQMAEILPLPEKLGLRETGVYASGFNWFTDNLVFPLIMLAHWIKKGWGVNTLSRLLVWGTNTFSPTTPGVSFVLEAQGIKEGKKRKVIMTIEPDDAYYFTAAPVVACLWQYFEGCLSHTGLSLMGNVVDDERLLKDLTKLGAECKTKIIDEE
jgi:saccharopine dehydrogenase (NAD+, L-lysine-forming)